MGLVASRKGLELADEARKRKGLNKQSLRLCDEALTSLGTLKRFWNPTIINADTFLNICYALGFTKEEIYEKIVDWENSTTARESINPSVLSSDAPFSDRGCIQNPKRLYDRQDIFKKLHQELSLGNSCSLVGDTEIGKSSILWKLCQEGVRKFNLPPTIFFYFDLQFTPDYKSFRYELCNLLKIQIDIDSSSFFPDLKRKLERKRCILCCDEIEVLQDFDEYLPETLRFLRGLASHPQIPFTLVTASRCSLNELFPDRLYKGSPFYNISTQINVPPFSKQDAKGFLKTRLANTNIQFSEAQIQSLIEESQCHPARLQEKAADLYHRLTVELVK